jgi:hypothetical protein
MGISPSQDLYLHRAAQHRNTRPRVGFELTIPAFEWPKSDSHCLQAVPFKTQPNNNHASKLLVALREAFSNMCPDKGVTYKTTIQRLITKFQVDACLREGGGHFQHLL